MTAEILPGAVLGVLGSGQLGRMFAMAARRLGYRVAVYSPDSQTPAGQLADREWSAPWDDREALTEFARHVDVVTLEFENISPEALRLLEKFVPVRPGPRVLEVAQHRLREKTTLRSLGLPTPEFNAIDSEAGLAEAISSLGGNGILKTAAWGYDGKGQQLLRPGDDLSAAWRRLQSSAAILEEFIPFEKELSVIAVRDPAGNVRTYDPIINEHAQHILDVSRVPADLPLSVTEDAKEVARQVMESLDVIGVLCVEMFLAPGGRLLINELAPRPHNSGHLTIEAHECSQFEQQVRAICGLPLGSTALRQPAAMANLLGDLWQNGTPRWDNVLKRSGLYLHLYGKSEPRPGRKMGHLTALAGDAESAAHAARAARDELLS